jgi:hypothetical protein
VLGWRPFSLLANLWNTTNNVEPGLRGDAILRVKEEACYVQRIVESGTANLFVCRRYARL